MLASISNLVEDITLLPPLCVGILCNIHIFMSPHIVKRFLCYFHFGHISIEALKVTKVFQSPVFIYKTIDIFECSSSSCSYL